MRYTIHQLVLLLLDSLLHYTCIKDMEIGKCTRIKLSVMGIGVVISNLFFTHSLCSSRILHVYLDLYGRCLFI